MTKLGLDVTVVAAHDLASCDLAGETAILHLTSGIYYTLNPVATTVWNLLKEPTSARQIHAALLDCYEVDAESCERDLLKLLQELSSHRLIEVRP